MKVEVLEVSHNNVRDSESCTENKLLLLKVFLQATESWRGQADTSISSIAM